MVSSSMTFDASKDRLVNKISSAFFSTVLLDQDHEIRSMRIILSAVKVDYLAKIDRGMIDRDKFLELIAYNFPEAKITVRLIEILSRTKSLRFLPRVLNSYLSRGEITYLVTMAKEDKELFAAISSAIRSLSPGDIILRVDPRLGFGFKISSSGYVYDYSALKLSRLARHAIMAVVKSN